MMASFFRNIGFPKQQAKGTNVNTSQTRSTGSPNPSPSAFSPTMPTLSQSSSFSSTSNTGPPTENGISSDNQAKKFFFLEKYAKLGVKGNFMPLAAQPANVDLGEWLAHQTVEQYRIICTLTQVVQEVDLNNKKPVCNPDTCPNMNAGYVKYTWLDNKKDPVPVPASQYISLVQRWMNGKIHDPKAFPVDNPGSSASAQAYGDFTITAGQMPNTAGSTVPQSPLPNSTNRNWIGKTVGFPESFIHDCRTSFRQIFRIYAHLYHSHWVDPFWHLSDSNNGQGWTDLNSCFVHFCTVAKLYGLLTDRDAEPMQPLIDIWIANGSIPQDAANGACAIVTRQVTS